MKKKILMIVAFFAMTLGVSAQPPQPTSNPTNPDGSPDLTKGIRGPRAPLAPATLLLLGLGGAAAGTMVYRNTKNKKEE